MPIIQSAIRKLRADKKKAVVNLRVKSAARKALAQARKKVTDKKLATVFSKLDRAVKSGVMHKNKAARLKSRLTAMASKK